MDKKQERVKFEAWSKDNGLWLGVMRDGVRCITFSEQLWEAWQASQLSNSDGYAETVRKCADVADKINPKKYTSEYEDGYTNACGDVYEGIMELLTAAPTPDGDRLDAERYRLLRFNSEFAVAYMKDDCKKLLELPIGWIELERDALDAQCDQAIANKEEK